MPFRSISTNNVPANPQTIVAPAGIQDGDILIAFFVADASTAGQRFPTGFTQPAQSPIVSTADGQTLAWAWKKASGESGNYTNLGAGAGDGLSTIGGIICLSGEDATNFLHRVSVATNNTANASPWTITSGVFAATAGVTDLIWISASDTNGTPPTSTAAPSGFTSRADFNDGAFQDIQVFTKDGVASGETGSYTSTVTDVGHTGGWDVFVIALLNASTAATPAPLAFPHPAVRGIRPTVAMVMRQLMNRFLGPTSFNQTEAPSAAGSTWSVAAPTVIRGGVTLTPAAISSSWSTAPPTILKTRTLAPAALSSTWAIAAPNVARGARTLIPAAVPSTWAVAAPSVVTGGAVTIAPSAVSSSWQVAAPSLIRGTRTLTPGALSSAWAFAAPSLIRGTRQVTPNAVGSVWSAAVPSLGGALLLSPTRRALSVSSSISLSLG